MARLGRLFDSLKKPTGDAAIGVSVEVRRQGATVASNQSSTSPFAVAVDDPGGIRGADTVRVNTGTTSYTVDAIAATTVTISGFGGTLVLNASDRLTPINNLPTLNGDRQGNIAAPNPMVTSTPRGEYGAYLDGGEYDLVTSGGGYGDTLIRDVYVSSPRMVFNVFDAGTAKAFILAVKNAITVAGGKMLSIQNADGNEVFAVDKDGSGLLAGSVGTAALADGAVTTIKIADANVTTAKILDANVTTAKLAANAVHPASVKALGGSGDVVLTTSEVVRCTMAYTPTAGNVGLRISVNVPYQANGPLSSIGRVELRLYIGGVLKATGILGGQTGVSEVWVNFGSIAFTWDEPAAAAALTTIEVREIRIDVAGTTVGTYKGTIYQGYLTTSEMKK